MVISWHGREDEVRKNYRNFEVSVTGTKFRKFRMATSDIYIENRRGKNVERFKKIILAVELPI